MTIGGSDLYIDIAAKAAVLCLSLIRIIRLWTGTSGWGMLPWRHSCCSMAARSRLRPTSKSRSCCQWHLAISLATTLLCGSGSTLSSDERRGIGLFVQTLKRAGESDAWEATAFAAPWMRSEASYAVCINRISAEPPKARKGSEG